MGEYSQKNFAPMVLIALSDYTSTQESMRAVFEWMEQRGVTITQLPLGVWEWKIDAPPYSGKFCRQTQAQAVADALQWIDEHKQ